MANTLEKVPGHDDMTTCVYLCKVDDYDVPLKDLDVGGTTLHGLTFNVASGSDIVSLWDHTNPTLGSDAQDYMFPTATTGAIWFLEGVEFSEGLTLTVSNVGGTVLSGDPSAANYLQLLTEPD